MLFVLALPVLAGVAFTQRYLQFYAPTNVLVRRVRSAPPRWRTVAGLLALAGALVTAMHALAEAVAAGAPGWLNLVVMVFAWDALKIIAVTLLAVIRRICRASTRNPSSLKPAKARGDSAPEATVAAAAVQASSSDDA